MAKAETPLVFEQIHIEVARNATDDFNPFHDKNKWQQVRNNPFGGAIALGFQMECLLEYRLKLHREGNGENALIDQHDLRYSNYQFNFANAVRCGEALDITIKPSQLREGDNTTLSNRVSLKADGRLALLGFKRESQQPLILPEHETLPLAGLAARPSRGYLGDSGFYLVRKFIMNGNAKNFLSGSLAEQSDYIDELEERVDYPETYPCSLMSCLLLEQGVEDGLDFLANPLVYTAHKISIDRALLADLHSNDALHLLSKRVEAPEGERHFECYGIVGEDRVLFRAEIALVSLASILGAG